MKKSKKHYDISEFIKSLSEYMDGRRTVVTDAGQQFFAVTRDLRLSDGDRMICSYAQADMGFSLPASIGVAFASGKPVIVVTGDGSFQLNIQELTVIKLHKLPIKIFVLNSNGYETMKNTQKKFFGRFIGVDKKTGISFPPLKKIADAYGLSYFEYRPEILGRILNSKNPLICEIK